MPSRALTSCDAAVLRALWGLLSGDSRPGLTAKELFGLAKEPGDTAAGFSNTAIKKSCRKLLAEGRIRQVVRGGEGGPGRTANAFALETERIVASRTQAEIVLLLYRKEGHAASETPFLDELLVRVDALEPGQSKDDIREKIEDCISKGYISRLMKDNRDNRDFLKAIRELVEEEMPYLDAIRLSNTKKPVSSEPTGRSGGDKEKQA